LAPAARQVAGRWSSPRAPSTFGRCRLGPRGVPWRAALSVPKHREVGPHGLDVTFRALLVGLEPLATCRQAGGRGFLLSWPYPLAPLRRLTVRASTPASSGELASVRRYHPTTLVPPSWFLTTSTAFSARRLRVCCTPLPALGFAAFREGTPGGPEGRRLSSSFPATGFVPFEGFPSSAAVPHHCGRCPPTVGR